MAHETTPTAKRAGTLLRVPASQPIRLSDRISLTALGEALVDTLLRAKERAS